MPRSKVVLDDAWGGRADLTGLTRRDGCMNVQLGNFLVENYARAQRTIDKFKTADEYRRDGCKVHSPFAIEENGK